MSSREKVKIDFLIDMQGAKFSVPKLRKATLTWIIERLGFEGFCLLVISRNSHIPLKRQVLEECWALIIRHAATKSGLLHPENLVQNNERVLLTMFQVEGWAEFAVEKFWLERAAEAANKGQILDITSTFNPYHSCLPMVDILSFKFEEYGPEMNSQFVAEQMKLCGSLATEFEHKWYKKNADKEWWKLVVPAVQKTTTEEEFYFDDVMEIDIENDDVGDPKKQWLLPQEREYQVLALRPAIQNQTNIEISAKVAKKTCKRKAATLDIPSSQFRKRQLNTIDGKNPEQILTYRPRV